jgi:hypothetical protein
MGIRDRMKQSLERAAADQSERERREGEERLTTVRGHLADGEELESLFACRAWDSLGEWVAMTSQRLLVTKRDGSLKQSLRYRDVQSVKRERDNVVLRIGGEVTTLYLKGEDVERVVGDLARRQAES